MSQEKLLIQEMTKLRIKYPAFSSEQIGNKMGLELSQANKIWIKCNGVPLFAPKYSTV